MIRKVSENQWFVVYEQRIKNLVITYNVDKKRDFVNWFVDIYTWEEIFNGS